MRNWNEVDEQWMENEFTGDILLREEDSLHRDPVQEGCPLPEAHSRA